MFNKFFGSNKTDLHENWKILDRVEQWEQILEASKDKPAAIFKHSTRCGVSSMIKYQLESNWNIDPQALDFYYLDLIANRAISNQIAEELDVVHESPQVILIQDRQVMYHDSHNFISVEALNNALKTAKV